MNKLRLRSLLFAKMQQSLEEQPKRIHDCQGGVKEQLDQLN